MRTDAATARGSAAVWRALEAELHTAREAGVDHPRVVDVGGGSGGWAVRLAAEGCLVTVVEPNPNALATLRRRAEEENVADRIVVIPDYSDSLGTHVKPGSSDLVLAHELLEVVDDPAAVVAALAEVLAPGGVASVLVANRTGAVLHRALSGRLGPARALLASDAGALGDDGETVLRRLDAGQLSALLTGAGLEVGLLQGDGVVSEAISAAAVAATETGEDDLAEFELAAATVPALRDIAARLHALARKPR